MEKLLNTSNRMETRMLADIFKLNHIPCYVKSMGPEEYIRVTIGCSFSGQEIYVLKQDHNRAMNLVQSLKKN